MTLRLLFASLVCWRRGHRWRPAWNDAADFSLQFGWRNAGSLADWQWCERCHIHVDGGGPQRTRRPDNCVYTR